MLQSKYVYIVASPMITVECITIFILACFVGFYVISNVTPALHAPLMSVTNAISSIIIIVGLQTAMTSDISVTTFILSLIAIFLASINIFGGFIITHKMLKMFQK